MSKVIGIVSEGPTDYLVLKAVIDKITGETNRYLSLQPERDMLGRFGNGWKGVWRWCEETEEINTLMKPVAHTIVPLITEPLLIYSFMSSVETGPILSLPLYDYRGYQ